MIVPVILSGGSGTRLWPLSRKLYPKQFIALVNNTTLFQETILRLPKDFSDPLIICNEDHRFLAAEQLREISKKTKGIILEPEGKNTAPAITLSALKFIDEGIDPILLVLSSDHIIRDIETFHKSIRLASELAKENKLITFGIIPDKAETGFGYIEAEINNFSPYFNIRSFSEKPKKKDVIKFLESGKYLWNSGMFMFKASVYLSELAKFEPQILSICKKSYKDKKIDSDFIRINSALFHECPNKSIDYAVMERTDNAIVIPMDTKWNDVGSWSSLWDIKNKDESMNVIEGDITINDVNDSYIYSSNRLVTITGVKNLVIIDTQDALLVAHKQKTKNIEKIVKKLQDNKRAELTKHRKVFRPWGYYDSIDSGKGFQVKRIVVNPGAKLSLQKHKYRSEHWVVVRGVALVTCDDYEFELLENQSTYIPQGSIHRLENHQEKPLEIIEIQTGSYLGEDDITRLEDDYLRNIET